MGKELTRTAVATLDFVADEHGARHIAGLTQTLHELGGSQLDAANTLDALHDAGCHIALCQLRLPSLEIVEGQEGGVAVGVDGRDDLGIIGDFDSQARAAVESLLCRQDTRTTSME